MSPFKKLLNICSYCVLTLSFFEMPHSAFGQVTTNIPSNLFLTDDGFLFWYKPGQRLVDVRKIKEAKNSSESQPASRDPEDNWGEATNGFQLSLHFEKQMFTNGEPIVAVMMMRNITNTTLTYLRPTYVLGTQDGKLLERKGGDLKQITLWPEVTIFPQTQQKYYENLSQDYDLSKNGDYIFQSVCKHPDVSSQKIVIKIE